MFGKVIFHVDVNSAYLSWEAAYRIHHLGQETDLRMLPSAVAGDVATRRGIILAKSIPAKKYGIATGMTIGEALLRCRELHMVPPNYRLYQRCSDALISLLKEYTPRVEQYSIDEAFLDMTESFRLFGEQPQETALVMKDRIRDYLGFTVNIGISSNKVLAKMAGELRKPDRVHTMFPWEIRDKMWPLPVSELFFVGRAAEKKLRTRGIDTIGDLARTDPELLRAALKSQGDLVWAFANGWDLTPVEEETPAQKGYGNSTTTPFDVTDAEHAKLVLLALAETVGTRLRKDKKKAGQVSVSIRTTEFQQYSHQAVLPEATDVTDELYRWACRLFDRLWKKEPLRHLGVHTARIQEADEIHQMNLEEVWEPGVKSWEKQQRLNRAVDQIRRRYGTDALKRAAFL